MSSAVFLATTGFAQELVERQFEALIEYDKNAFVLRGTGDLF